MPSFESEFNIGLTAEFYLIMTIILGVILFLVLLGILDVLEFIALKADSITLIPDKDTVIYLNTIINNIKKEFINNNKTYFRYIKIEINM